MTPCHFATPDDEAAYKYALDRIKNNQDLEFYFPSTGNKANDGHILMPGGDVRKVDFRRAGA